MDKLQILKKMVKGYWLMVLALVDGFVVFKDWTGVPAAQKDMISLAPMRAPHFSMMEK